MLSYQPEAYAYGAVYLLHRAVVKLAHALLQALLVDGTYLLEQYDRVFDKPAARVTDALARGHLNVGGKLSLSGAAGYCRRDDSRAVFVAHIVLNDEHGSHAALLGPDHWAEIGVIYVSSVDSVFVILCLQR